MKHTFRKSFKMKIILPIVVVLIALVGVLNAFFTARFSDLSDLLINSKLIANANTLQTYLDDSRANTKAAAVSSAFNPAVITAVSERDRDKIFKLFTDLKNLYRISYFTICDNEGNVLVRTYDFETFGDSVSNQQNISDALNGKVSTYFESGTLSKVSVRTGAPLYNTNGILVGVISAGVRLDTDDAVNELKQLFNSEVTVFWGDTRIATTMTKDGRSVVGTTIDPHIAEIVIENRQEYSADVEVFGKEYKAFHKPLLNPQNKVFSTIVFSIPKMEVIAMSKNSIRNGLILGMGGLTVSIVLYFIIISLISKPIIKLSNDMGHIANGDLNIDINIKSEDEVGYLAKSLQMIVDILHKLLEGINTMIVEHQKGNTDYHLNTEKFLGSYKTLADNVVELAAFSIHDQLTGMPNRRSFASRLNMEWGRSIREKESLSILMIDVDHFKNYNDTFGHGQGDVALQTVANTLRRSIRRTVDFAARWGGEEFIVSLPNTDSNGASMMAEKIRAAVENSVILCADKKAERVTVSIGVYGQIPFLSSSIGDFIAKADEALYQAKATGRNKVCTSPDHT